MDWLQQLKVGDSVFLKSDSHRADGFLACVVKIGRKYIHVKPYSTRAATLISIKTARSESGYQCFKNESDCFAHVDLCKKRSLLYGKLSGLRNQLTLDQINAINKILEE